MEEPSDTETIQESESVEESTLEETSVAEMSLEDLVEEENQIEETTEEETVAEVYSGEDAELISEEDIENIEPLAATRTLVSTHTEHHDYIYAGGKLLRDTIITTTGSNTTTEILDFRYDENGYPYSLIHTVGSTTTTYYYITNLQGDVMYLVDDNGTPVASYTYDPYGNILIATGSMAEKNPLRYRGCCYDEETGFYYLQSRYYDAEIARFINADSYLSTGQSFLGHNAFSYCGNNPVNRVDSDGEAWETVWDMDVADDIKDATGAYVVLYEGGQHYIGKGGFQRAIKSAQEHMTNTNKVSAIVWAPTSSRNSAFVTEYLLQSTLGSVRRQNNSFNIRMSPGKNILAVLR